MAHQNLSSRLTRPRPMFLIALGLIVTLFGWPFASQAQPAPNSSICYAIADNQGKLPGGGTGNNQDLFLQLNLATGATTLIGPTNTLNDEAMTFVSNGNTDTLYAVDGGTLGTVNLATGAFTAIGPAGSGTGSAGTINFNVIIGLAYDAQTQTLYATQSHAGQNAILLKLDPQTGAHIPNAFGPGQDYLSIPPVLINGQPAQIVDDFQFDPTSGLLYAAVNVDGADGKLVTLDPNTAAVTEIGTFRDTATGATVDNLEGLGFDATGQLYASGGNHGPHPQDNNKLWKIDKQTGSATVVGPFTPGHVDIESLGCLTSTTATPTNTPTDTPTNTPAPPTNTPTDTPTNTPVAPTNTPTDTPTNTPVSPTNTPTDTPTNTPVLPTNTPTDTPTNTPVPPTSTATATPTSTSTVEPPTGLDPVGEPSAPPAAVVYLPLVTK